ncbi:MULTISPECIES: hypothetical protein [unclassified Ruegeria]|uniref:hypothetical protein n=1 Tax=unclassified Ruegeria TaxID=2625375 RepID=UPI0014912CB9|nr:MULTISPECIES: hypothetical protein [unclassified Ruegeria]NOD88371.1 hypothetical protein [Ruegeria sp. HKCCD4318]NOE13280.1 hypothetical protein [Ruegeria sp. HKCCD4318-2]NOG11178.1 hypothetical protein [Ruegeria sp. HKCCD4315]
MPSVEQIFQETDFDQPQSVSEALTKMRSVPDYELHLLTVKRDTVVKALPDTRRKMALAQFELDRRATVATENLAKATTTRSGIIGIAGVVIGAVIGAALQWWLANGSPQ